MPKTPREAGQASVSRPGIGNGRQFVSDAFYFQDQSRDGSLLRALVVTGGKSRLGSDLSHPLRGPGFTRLNLSFENAGSVLH
jgi:hypothetical protein